MIAPNPDRRRRRDAGRGCRTAGGRPNHKNERQTYPAVATGTELFHVSFAERTVVFEYERDGKRAEVTVSPVLINGSYRYGISGNVNATRQKTNALQTLEYSAYEVGYWIETTVSSLKLLVQGGVSINDMSGPVGVVDAIGETYEESRSDGAFYVWLNLLNVAILLSANLGVMNLLPIPALDGGRLVFLIVEAIRKKRIEPELEAKIHFTGLMLLLLLMVFVMFNDVRKIFF